MAGRKTRTSWKDEVSRVLRMGHPVGGDLGGRVGSVSPSNRSGMRDRQNQKLCIDQGILEVRWGEYYLILCIS